MKDIGIVGVPSSGKSTLFTALTKAGTAGGRANQAVVPVPDPRVEVLGEMESSRRLVPARVRFLDVPGATSPRGLASLRETDALCVVLRAFGLDPEPEAELAELTTELTLADLAVAEPALENARRRGRSQRRGGSAELALLERAVESLSMGTPLRQVAFDEDERKQLRGLAPLTLKPWVAVLNLEEGAVSSPNAIPEAVGVWAAIEAETAGMPEEDARALLCEFGVSEPGLDRVIAACYRALDLITFLTTGPDETRAWEVRRGATAPEAAGTIHSDLERGFIRAEVVAYEDLIRAGGWDRAKAKGSLRVEGRDYVVREGDVMHVRFSV